MNIIDTHVCATRKINILDTFKFWACDSSETFKTYKERTPLSSKNIRNIIPYDK